MSDEKPQDEIIDVEPQVIEDAQSQPKAKGQLNAPKIAGLCVAVGALCAVAGGWLYRDYLASYLPSDQLQALQAKVDALEAADKNNQKRADAFVTLTEELKVQLSAAQSASEKSAKENADTAALEQGNAQAIGDLKKALDDASKTVDALKVQIASGVAGGMATSADPSLETRVAALEKQVAALNVPPAPQKPAGLDITAVQQTFGDMRTKIEAGLPYAPEFKALQSLVPAAAGLDVIGAESEMGLPNEQALAAQLTSLAGQLPKPVEAPAQSNSSWMPDITGYLSSLITVKTVGESDAAVVASQALVALQAGDLQKASNAISSATVPLPAAFNDWQDRLKRRLKLEQAVAALAAGLSHLPQVKG